MHLNPIKRINSWLASGLIALSFLYSAYGATPVCGTIVNGHWTKADSPYIVTCDILVATLTIDPGVEVLFESNYVFEVAGQLTALGTAEAPIVFTQTNNAGGWQGIYFNNTGPGSQLVYCSIFRAVNSAVRLAMSAAPLIRFCRFSGNSTPTTGGAIDADVPAGDLVLDGCLFETNSAASHGGAVHASMGSGAIRIINGCEFSGNIAHPGSGNGNFVGGALYVIGNADIANAVFTNNVSVSRCSGGLGCDVTGYAGAAWLQGGNSTIRNSVFVGNTTRAINAGTCFSDSDSRSWGGAIYLSDGVLRISDTILTRNVTEATGCRTSRAGSGLFVNSGTCALVNVTCAYNSNDGIYVAGGATGITNAIVYFNGGTQIGGNPSVTYSDVQGGFIGEGNISFNPIFLSTNVLTIVPGSPCIDAGDPALAYNDICFPPSLGGPRNDMGAHGGPGACCWDGPCDAPSVTSQPPNLTACIGSAAVFCVATLGSEPLSYQWRFHGSNAGNSATNLPFATNACLTLSNVQSNNAGYYSVVVSNAFGAVFSSTNLLTVTPVCVSIDLYAGLTIAGGTTGQVYQVQYVTNVEDTAWTTLTTITQTLSGTFVLDPQPANRPRKFYRVIP